MNPSPTTQERPIEDHPNRTIARTARTPAVSPATLSAYSTDWPLYYPLPPSGGARVAPVAEATRSGEVGADFAARTAAARKAAAHLISDADYCDHLDRLPDWDLA